MDDNNKKDLNDLSNEELIKSLIGIFIEDVLKRALEIAYCWAFWNFAIINLFPSVPHFSIWMMAGFYFMVKCLF